MKKKGNDDEESNGYEDEHYESSRDLDTGYEEYYEFEGEYDESSKDFDSKFETSSRYYEDEYESTSRSSYRPSKDS